MIDARQYADQVKRGPHGTPLCHRFNQRTRGVVRPESTESERSDQRFPNADVEPAVQVQDVKKQIDQSNDARPPLPAVAAIAAELVLATVGFPRFGNPDPNHRVKNQRREDQAPLNQRKQFPRAVNEENSTLECCCAVEQAGIGHKVYRHVQTERNDP